MFTRLKRVAASPSQRAEYPLLDIVLGGAELPQLEQTASFDAYALGQQARRLQQLVSGAHETNRSVARQHAR